MSKQDLRFTSSYSESDPAHYHPLPPSDTESSSSDSDVPLTLPKDAKLKYSVIDGTPG